MTIDPDGEIAPYLQLAAILRAQIESGELAPGAKLPSIIDLSQTYTVARVTAHKGPADPGRLGPGRG